MSYKRYSSYEVLDNFAAGRDHGCRLRMEAGRRRIFAFWRNQYMTADYTKDTLVPAMDAMYASLVRNQDKPDLIPCDSKMWVLYLSALQDQQRFSNTNVADAGFTNIMFMQAPVVLDGGLAARRRPATCIS